MFSFSQFGNELYSGKKSFNFIGRRYIWFAIAAVLMIVSLLIPVVQGGFNLGIEFRGGAQFTLNTKDKDTGPAKQVVSQFDGGNEAHITHITENKLRVQITDSDGHGQDANQDKKNNEITQALAKAYDIPAKDVSSTYIGPSWGESVSQQALIGVAIFIALVAILMAIYFRTWKMSLSAIIGLIVVLVVTIGIYALLGSEITPSAIIGFLTILSYALYDTVVVFDKIRENTKDYSEQNYKTYGQLVNLAINQTLVRSINTSVVAILPVASILFIGVLLLGAGSLQDLSLALFIGTIIGALSTLFIQAPLYAQLRMVEPSIKEHDKHIQEKYGETDQEAYSDASYSPKTSSKQRSSH